MRRRTRLYGKMDFIRELKIEPKIKLFQNWFSHFGFLGFAGAL